MAQRKFDHFTVDLPVLQGDMVRRIAHKNRETLTDVISRLIYRGMQEEGMVMCPRCDTVCFQEDLHTDGKECIYCNPRPEAVGVSE